MTSMSRKRVSIVIPNYNYGRFLPRIALSLTNQTIGVDVCEIIFVDDGSTDESMDRLACLEELPSAGFRVVELEHTGSPATVRNTGLQLAEAPYAVCLDPDDLPSPEWLAACVATMEEQPKTGLVYTHFIRSQDGDCRRMELPEYSHEELATRNILPPAPVMRRKVFEASDGFRDNTDYEIWDFGVQAALNGFGFTLLNATYYAYMIHGENRSLKRPPEDGPSKAAIVRNNPQFFPEQAQQWAEAVIQHSNWAEHFTSGVIPDATSVEKMLKNKF